jgi:hypothetical protein
VANKKIITNNLLYIELINKLFGGIIAVTIQLFLESRWKPYKLKWKIKEIKSG